MNQTYPRLIALGSRKRAKRAALSRTGPIFVESEAGRSIVIESLRARARACIRLPPPLSTTPPRSTMIPPPRPSPRYRERKRDSVFSPTRPPRSVSAFFHVRYCMVGGGEGEGWSARQIHPANGLCGCKAAIRHNTRKGPFSVSTSEVVVPFLNSFIASTVAVNQTPLSFYCPRSRSSRRSIVTTRGRTHSLLHTRITNGNSFVLFAIATSPTYLPTTGSTQHPCESKRITSTFLPIFADDIRVLRKIETLLDRIVNDWEGGRSLLR